jgi:exonuclease VII small subunit
MEIGGKQVQNIEVKKQRFEEIKTDLEKEKITLDKDISQLRNALSTNTTTQSVDKKTGQLVTKANNANRKSFELQLASTQTNKDKLSTKIDALNDSITNLDIKVLDMESKASEGNELGAIQYVSEITGANVKTVANWFIFLLIFVFDPLAITLIIATNKAFEDIKPKKNIYGEIKSIEPEPEPEPEPVPEPQLKPQPNPAIEQERQNILHEIQRVERSGAAHAARSVALTKLRNKLSSLSDDNTKTY